MHERTVPQAAGLRVGLLYPSLSFDRHSPKRVYPILKGVALKKFAPKHATVHRFGSAIHSEFQVSHGDHISIPSRFPNREEFRLIWHDFNHKTVTVCVAWNPYMNEKIHRSKGPNARWECTMLNGPPPELHCGWRCGDTGGDTGRSTRKRFPPRPKRSIVDGGTGQGKVGLSTKPSQSPTAACPVCGASVFFYQSLMAGRVFLWISFGPPWPKTSMHGPGSAAPSGARRTGTHFTSGSVLDTLVFAPLLSSKTQKGFSFVRSARLASRCAQEGRSIESRWLLLPLPCRQRERVPAVASTSRKDWPLDGPNILAPGTLHPLGHVEFDDHPFN